MEFYLGYFLIAIFEMYLLIDFFHDEFEQRFDTIVPTALFSIMIVMLNTLLPMRNMQLNTIIDLALYFIFIRVCFEGDIKRISLRYIIFIITLASGTLIVNALAILIAKEVPIDMEFVRWLCVCFFAMTLNYIMLRFFKKRLGNNQVSFDGKAKPMLVIQLTLILFLFFFSLRISFNLPSEALYYASFEMLAIFAMMVVMLISADFLSKREREHSEYEMLLAKSDMQMKYYSRIEEIDKQQTIYRHDMKHYLSAIAGLAEQGKDDKIIELIEQMGADISRITPRVFTSNGFLNALLGEKESNAQRHAVKIEFTIEPGVNVDFIKDTDMISMFGNLIDNAIRAEMEFDGDKVMKIRLFETDGNFLMFSVENHFVGDRTKKNGKYVTTKTNKERHGLGIQSVENLANKYGGMLTLNEEGNVFMADLLLSKPYAA